MKIKKFCRKWLDRNQWASVMSLIIVPILVLLIVVAGCYFFLHGPARKIGFAIAGLSLAFWAIFAVANLIMKSMLDKYPDNLESRNGSFRAD